LLVDELGAQLGLEALVVDGGGRPPDSKPAVAPVADERMIVDEGGDRVTATLDERERAAGVTSRRRRPPARHRRSTCQSQARVHDVEVRVGGRQP
jgi:hypothetical protein